MSIPTNCSCLEFLTWIREDYKKRFKEIRDTLEDWPPIHYCPAHGLVELTEQAVWKEVNELNVEKGADVK